MAFKYKLGLKKSQVDSRDVKLCVPHNMILPIKHEIPIIRCMYNQLDLNSCSSNVICNQIMSLKDYTDNNYPSRLFQYYVSRQIVGNENNDDGCTYRDAYQGLAMFGFTDEQLCPYDSSKVFDKPSQEAYEKANKTLVKTYKSLLHSAYAIKYDISHNRPVACGKMIYENFIPDDNFIIPLPAGEMQGGHAMTIISYNDETRLFKVQNSWGIEWSDKGCCFMHYEHILNPEWCFELWVITKE